MIENFETGSSTGIRNALAVVLLGFALAACDGGPPGDDEPDYPPGGGGGDGGDGSLPEDRWPQDLDPDHALNDLSSCGEVQAYAVEAARHALSVKMMIALGQYDDSSASDADIDADVDADSDADADGDASGDPDFTGTNLQEEGVDEADLVKTDGERLYALTGEELVIVSAEAGELEVLGRIGLPGSPIELILYHQVVIAFFRLDESEVPEEIRYPQAPAPSAWADQPPRSYTGVAIVDVAGGAAPELLRTVTYAAGYLSSRRVGDALRVVLRSPIPALQLPVHPSPEAIDSLGAEAAHAQLFDENMELAEALDPEDILPRKLDAVAGQEDDAEPEQIARCGDHFGAATPQGIALTSVASLQLGAPLTPQRDVSVFGDAGLVYASSETLYLATSRRYVLDALASQVWKTDSSGIHAFDIQSNPGLVLYLASGTVDGHMLDQFCLGEHDGYLRVATVTGSGWSGESHLWVLEASQGALQAVGEIHGIGQNEDLYAARFIGDLGFMVTFMEYDPLFVFDLADPHDPQLVGSWEGPGFSTYLHPLGEDHLIALGREGGDEVISIYDMTELASPALVERLALPGWDYHTPALDDHKAFTLWQSRDLLALPYRTCENPPASGALLYEIDTSGVDEAGIADLGGDEVSQSPAQRVVMIDDHLYSISRCRISSAAIETPAAGVDTVALYDGDSCQPL